MIADSLEAFARAYYEEVRSGFEDPILPWCELDAEDRDMWRARARILLERAAELGWPR
jgi:hypothetical protein